MSAFVIEGGTVVTAEGLVKADVAVSDGLVVALGRNLAGASDIVVDAEGKLVLPGCVDTHTHMEAPHNDLDSPAEEAVTCDDFRDGTIAAAVGGTTTIVDFATQAPDQTLAEARAQWEAKLIDRPPAVHVGLHMIVTSLDFDGADDELASLCEAGITSYKLFLAYKESPLWVDDSMLFRVAQVAARAGALVMAHCENGGAIEVLQQQALARGETDPIYHARTRPPQTEAEAIARVATLCQTAGAPAFVMHVSCREAVEAIAHARRAGARIWGETCPHYLAFSEDVMLQGGLEAAKYLVTPPLRPAEHHDALWRALADGTLSVVSTDHCPYLTKWKAAAGNFLEIPNGAPGVENRLEVMYELAVRQGRLDVSRLVDLLSTTPARLFGMFPQKGTIAVGSDADIVIFNPARRKVITATQEMSKCDYSLYEGMQLAGSVETVFFRGEQIVENGRYAAGREHGAFLPRGRFGDRQRAPSVYAHPAPAWTVQ
jgi:dihydropyrimidinase